MRATAQYLVGGFANCFVAAVVAVGYYCNAVGTAAAEIAVVGIGIADAVVDMVDVVAGIAAVVAGTVPAPAVALPHQLSSLLLWLFSRDHV